MSCICPLNLMKIGLLTAEIGSVVWGTPANFNGFRVLASLLQRRRSTEANQNFAQCLAVSWAGTLYIHFRALLPQKGILPGAKFTLRSRLALSYIDSVTARHSSSGSQTNFAALSRGRHLHSAGRPSRWALARILAFMEFHGLFIVIVQDVQVVSVYILRQLLLYCDLVHI